MTTEEEVLDIGTKLKREKLQRENGEKVERLKKAYRQDKRGEKEQSSASFIEKYQLLIFILIICIVAFGLRLYVASMPITETWAESIVKENLERQVSKKITEEYSFLSDFKKEELILQGTTEALAAAQNQQAITDLSKTYKESYRDPQGNTYLYEIDPYFFYRIATQGKDSLSKEGHTLLAFIERWWYTAVSFFLPEISFLKAIFYIPLFFTILTAITILFLGKEVWNELAGFIAALFFTIHPIVLEFSLLGFVDTNMVNIFIVMITGLLFLLIVRCLRAEMKHKYALVLLLLSIWLFFMFAFSYLWSAWYIAVIIPAAALGAYGIVVLWKKIMQLLKDEQKRKYVFYISVVFVVITMSLGFYIKQNKEQIFNKLDTLLPENVAKYLHITIVDKKTTWPDAFSLIKELQTTDGSVFIEYMGGNTILIVILAIFIYMCYLLFKKSEVKYSYILISLVLFGLLSFRAVRVFPYFVPYLSLFLGAGVALLWKQIRKRIMMYSEKAAIKSIVFIVIWVCMGLLFVYPLMPEIKQTANIIPIMDDAIYDSTVYIKETSNSSAIVSAWWDRGTFYNALAERDVHLQSQPYMPTTFWLSQFYATESELVGKNIISMLNCKGEIGLYNVLGHTNNTLDVIEMMQTVVTLSTKETQANYLFENINGSSKIVDEEENEINYWSAVNSISCAKKEEETYIVLIDDLMPRFSAVEYFAAWNFETQQPDPKYPYTDIEEYGCLRSSSGVYCTVQDRNIYVNFTSLEFTGQIPIHEVYVVENNTVQYMQQNTTATTATSAQEWTLITYNRAGYWKAVYLPKQVADSMYVRLMLLDGYNTTYFEKVFDEVHVETSWVKVYKVNWDGTIGFDVPEG